MVLSKRAIDYSHKTLRAEEKEQIGRMASTGRGKAKKVSKKYKIPLSAAKKYSLYVKKGIKLYGKGGKPPLLEEEDKTKLRKWFGRKRGVFTEEEFHDEVVKLARARHISRGRKLEKFAVPYYQEAGEGVTHKNWSGRGHYQERFFGVWRRFLPPLGSLLEDETGVCEEIEEEDAVVAKEKLKVDEEETYSSREEVAANAGGTGSVGAAADKDTDDVDDCSYQSSSVAIEKPRMSAFADVDIAAVNANGVLAFENSVTSHKRLQSLKSNNTHFFHFDFISKQKSPFEEEACESEDYLIRTA
eukprot:scaffold3408_cov162-Ochromonas_danica.AAC.2